MCDTINTTMDVGTETGASMGIDLSVINLVLAIICAMILCVAAMVVGKAYIDQLRREREYRAIAYTDLNANAAAVYVPRHK